MGQLNADDPFLKRKSEMKNRKIRDVWLRMGWPGEKNLNIYPRLWNEIHHCTSPSAETRDSQL